jgi:hypothetical protein
MFRSKYIAAAAAVGLLVGVSPAGAAVQDMITGKDIKNGTVALRDLTPGVQALIKQHAKDGVNGTNGVNGAKGADGRHGVSVKGDTGATGAKGDKGRDGVRYDRIVGDDDVNAATGEITVGNGAARLFTPTQGAWAQIRTYPTNLTLSQIDTLSFSSNSDTSGVVYLKVTTEGGHTVVFSPNTQPGGERGVGSMATFNVIGGTVRVDNDGGADEISWNEAVALLGSKLVKDVRVTAGASGPVGSDGALVQVDDLTINSEVIDFN